MARGPSGLNSHMRRGRRLHGWIRRTLPCQRRSLRMWEFNPEGPRAIQSFVGLTHEEMYKSFFGPQIECLDTTEDVGLSSNRTAEQVRNPLAEHTVFYSS